MTTEKKFKTASTIFGASGFIGFFYGIAGEASSRDWGLPTFLISVGLLALGGICYGIYKWHNRKNTP